MPAVILAIADDVRLPASDPSEHGAERTLLNRPTSLSGGPWFRCEALRDNPASPSSLPFPSRHCPGDLMPGATRTLPLPLLIPRIYGSPGFLSFLTFRLLETFALPGRFLRIHFLAPPADVSAFLRRGDLSLRQEGVSRPPRDTVPPAGQVGEGRVNVALLARQALAHPAPNPPCPIPSLL